MSVVFPNNNLPTASQPWGREVQKQLSGLLTSNQAESINNSARDNQLNSSIIALTGVVNDVKTVLTEIGILEDVVLDPTDPTKIDGANLKVGSVTATAIAANAITSAKIAANTITASDISTDYVYAGEISADQINTGSLSANFIDGGAITASSLTLTSSSYEIRVGTSSSFAYLRVAPNAPNGVGINAIGIVSSSTGGVIGNWFPYDDGIGNCGVSDFRWDRLYATNATVLTSDSRLKNDIKDASLGLEFIEKLRPVSYKMNVGQRDYVTNNEGELQYGENGKPLTTERPGIRRHWGLVAQEVKQVLDELNAEDFAGYVVNDLEDPDSLLSLSYEQFISPMIKAIQELSARVETLENGA